MLLIRFLHFLKGYVRFCADGGFPERFLNLCSRAGIVLWEVESRNGCLFASTTVKGYLAIRPAARKSGMRVRVKEKHGLPFFTKKHRRRVGLLLGLLCFCSLLFFLSTRIWTLEVIGNTGIREEEILETFAQLGVYVGAPRKNIQLNSVEIQALDRMRALSWVNLNVKGSGAVIEVREKGKEAEIDLPDKPADLIALRDGKLLVLEAYRGTAIAKIGDAVLRGDVLISAITVNKDETVTLRGANGYAVAKTQHTLLAQAEQTKEAGHISARRTRYSVQALGYTLPLGKALQPRETEISYRFAQWLELNGHKMPFGITRSSALTLTPCTVQHDARQLRLLALEEYAAAYCADLQRTRVEKHSAKRTESAGSCTISGKASVQENIGLRRELEGAYP